MTPAVRTQFNSTLFKWFSTNGRTHLPWRKTKDAYRILVSEVMLQQTQVERVLPKYDQFLKKFPSVEALAKSPLGDVLRIWSGLGYNRRAKYLWECAKEVTESYGGVFPKAFDALKKLPGIGGSTAAAICAFAYGKDESMIDTNIRRVLCRVFFKNEIPSDAELYEFAESLVPKGKGRDWNWAMMDVGATLCKAKGHLNDCPFQKLHGPVGDFQYKKPQSQFAGSRRFYRGRVLAYLAETPEGLATSKLPQLLELSHETVGQVIAALKREALIAQKGKKIYLPL